MKLIDHRADTALSQQGSRHTPVLVAGRFRRNAYWGAALVLGVLVCLISFTDAVPLEQRLLAGAVAVIGLIPSFLYFLRGARESLPLLALDGAFYSFTFGFPTFSSELAWLSSESSVAAALWLTIFGLLFLYLAYYASGFWFKRAPYLRISNASRAGQVMLGWFAMSAHLIFAFVPAFREIPSAGHFFNALGWIGLAILYPMYLERRLPFVQQLALFGVALPLELLPRLTSGALYQVLVVGIFMILIYWKVKRKLPVIAILLLVGFFTLLSPVKGTYRNILSASEATHLEKIEFFAAAAIDYYKPLLSGESRDEGGSTVNRVANISTFSYVVEMTPDAVPYWGGHTYTSILVSFVPRLIWPEKPVSTFGNEFGQRYSLLHAADDTTSYNLAWLTEFYANFGNLGVFVGMAIVGIVFRFLMAILNNPQANSMEYALGLTLVFGLFYAETNLAAMWGGLVITYITFSLLLRMASQLASK